MRMTLALLVAIIGGLQRGDDGKEKNPMSPYRAESSAYVVLTKGIPTYVTENRSFQFVDVLADHGEHYEAVLLLEETYRNGRTDGVEGVRGKATVKAWTVDPGGQRKLRWTVQETGNEGTVQDRLFRVTAWGCCDVPTIHTYFNLLTGKKLYVSNSDLLGVWGEDNGPQGFRVISLGYRGLDHLSHGPQLQYGTDTRVAQRFSVISPRHYADAPEMFVTTGEKLEKSLDLRDAVLTFVIVLKYADGIELRIPVEADVIRAEKAELPEGYSLHVEN